MNTTDDHPQPFKDTHFTIKRIYVLCFVVAFGLLLIGFLVAVIEAAKNSNCDDSATGTNSNEGASSSNCSASSAYVFKSWLNGPACPQTLQLMDLNLNDSGIQAALTKIPSLIQKFLSVEESLGFSGAQPSFSLMVVYRQETLLSLHLGVVNNSDPRSAAPTGDTIYGIGSVTKIMTSFLLTRLIDKGLVSLDDPVSKFFNDAQPPAFHPIDPYVSGPVTLQSLASQTSGLSRESRCTLYNPPSCSVQDIFDSINQTPRLAPLYTSPHYSNLGFALLGRCLERAVNNMTTYEDYMTSTLQRDVGMMDSGFGYPDDVIKRMAVGYGVVGGKLIPSSFNYVDCGWPSPAGCMHSTPNDMTKFIKYLFATSNSSSTTHYGLPGFNYNDGASGFGLFGWESAFANGYWTLTKGGLLPGFAASLALVPDLQIGAAAFWNIDSGDIDAVTAGGVMDVLVPAVVQYLKANQPTPALPPNYSSLLGTYGTGGVAYLAVSFVASPAPGHLSGGIAGFPSTIVMAYDEAQSTASGMIALRFTLADTSTSCLYSASVGANALIFFYQNAGTWYANVPDQAWFQLIKMS